MPMADWLRGGRNREKMRDDAAQWVKCPSCGEVLYRPDLSANLDVCARCSHHFRMHAHDRILSLIDGDFEEIARGVLPADPLAWTDKKSYPQKLAADAAKSGMDEAVLCGFGRIGAYDLALGVMDFHFRGGTMGSVVGERLTRLIEAATDRGLPCVIFTASGGARMEEGMLALMQMAKTTAAVVRLKASGQPFVTVLTDPTTGGVSASFAFQADIILAERNAMIGFAGRRVIEQTIRQRLPDRFQTAEFLLERGHIDGVLDRPNVKPTLERILGYARAGVQRRQRAELSA